MELRRPRQWRRVHTHHLLAGSGGAVCCSCCFWFRCAQIGFSIALLVLCSSSASPCCRRRWTVADYYYFIWMMLDARSYLIAIVQLHIIYNYNFQFRQDFHHYVTIWLMYQFKRSNFMRNAKRPGYIVKLYRSWTAFNVTIRTIVAETSRVTSCIRLFGANDMTSRFAMNSIIHWRSICADRNDLTKIHYSIRGSVTLHVTHIAFILKWKRKYLYCIK